MMNSTETEHEARENQNMVSRKQRGPLDEGVGYQDNLASGHCMRSAGYLLRWNNLRGSFHLRLREYKQHKTTPRQLYIPEKKNKNVQQRQI